MSHNTHEGIRNLSPVSSISLALLLFYFITIILHNIIPFILIFSSKTSNYNYIVWFSLF